MQLLRRLILLIGFLSCVAEGLCVEVKPRLDPLSAALSGKAQLEVLNLLHVDRMLDEAGTILIKLEVRADGKKLTAIARIAYQKVTLQTEIAKGEAAKTIRIDRQSAEAKELTAALQRGMEHFSEDDAANAKLMIETLLATRRVSAGEWRYSWIKGVNR